VQCASALQQLGVRRVFYGCANERFGGCGSVVDVCAVDRRFAPPLQVCSPITRDRNETLVLIGRHFYISHRFYELLSNIYDR